jgi:hypothetical protein
MRLTIVGVGQMVDFESGDMRNQLQVQDDHGQVHVITTDEDTVHELVKIVAGVKARRSGMPPMSGGPEDADFTQEYGVYERSQSSEAQAEDLPDGANVFGGDEPTDSPEEAEIAAVDDPTALRDRARRSRKKASKPSDFAQAAQDDRSGIPTRTLPSNLVDEKGNPILPGGAPDTSMDDEEDPGEIGQI